MKLAPVRAICFDLDNTLWEVEPVLLRAERILADWLGARYPKIPAAFSPPERVEMRMAVLRERPERAHDFTFLRRESIARMAEAAGYDRAMAHDAFAIWHAARNEVSPYAEVVPVLERLRSRYRLATLSNGNADLAKIGLAHHFEVTLHAGALGCAKPDLRTYQAVADALTLKPAEILFVGDEPESDVAGPRTAGMQTVWMNRGGVVWTAALPAADASVTDLDGLAALLSQKL
jgi:putative hydrolase of the HAD superfamily